VPGSGNEPISHLAMTIGADVSRRCTTPKAQSTQKTAVGKTITFIRTKDIDDAGYFDGQCKNNMYHVIGCTYVEGFWCGKDIICHHQLLAISNFLNKSHILSPRYIPIATQMRNDSNERQSNLLILTAKSRCSSCYSSKYSYIFSAAPDIISVLFCFLLCFRRRASFQGGDPHTIPLNASIYSCNVIVPYSEGDADPPGTGSIV
jgi:hypothetical protein